MLASDNNRSIAARPLTEVYPELVDKQYIPVLKISIWVILVGSAVFGAWMVTAPAKDFHWRLYIPVSLAVLAGVAQIVLHYRGPIVAMRLLALGGWTLATVGAISANGVRAPVLLVYPMIVIFSGWVLGARYGVGMFIASGIAVVAMAVAQSMGMIGGLTPFPPLIMALAYLIVLAISISLTLYLLRSFRDSYARYRLLTENIKDVVWILDAETLCFRYVSPSVEALSGYTQEESLAAPMTRTLTTDTGARLIELIRSRARSLVSGKSRPDDYYTDEIEQPCKDGSTVWVEVITSFYRNGENGRLEVRGVSRDISERKRAEAHSARLEAQLHESQKMEALGTLAGGVAHDFNNVLATILGNVELARQDVGPCHAALVSLNEIGMASRRAKDLVQQILIFGRRQKLEPKVTSLALVVVETTRLLRGTLPSEVTLNVDCRGDTPAVLADATQVKQVLLSLCRNALDAIQDQERPGTIDVNLYSYDHAHGEVHGELPLGRYACLAVRDNGSGMDEFTRSRLFEPFFTTKAVGKGTGLGLAVVYGIAQAHGASMEVTSTPGEGAEFRIYFPAVSEAIPEIRVLAADGTPAQTGGTHILYVDDEEAIVFLMKRLLERKGYRVSGYSDSREAIAALRATPDEFDLVVTDYKMPAMTGLEVAGVIRAIRPDLPVVMASGYVTEELRQEAPAVGIRELIYKPNTVEELCEAVARFCCSTEEKKG